MDRKIIHIDMDAFYASVEELDQPQLKGSPLIVGGSPHKRGVVATANYIARKFGIRSAMSSRRALELCPDAIFLAPRFSRYREISNKIREIFFNYTHLVEPLSLDEAYLDVTERAEKEGSAKAIALEIKQRIMEKTGLTSSAGVGPNKLIAKIASDYEKPNGLTVVSPKHVRLFLDPLPIRRIPGVGPVTESKLLQKNIVIVKSLREINKDILISEFGKTGAWLSDASNGIDDRLVQSSRVRKSLSAEDTFEKDLIDLEDMKVELKRIGQIVSTRLREKSLLGRTISLKITYSDFTKVTRAITLNTQTNDVETLSDTATTLLIKHNLFYKPIRLLGIGCSSFEPLPTKISPLNLSHQLSFNW